MDNTAANMKASAADVELAFNQERERLHRQMLSSVSHDLKTPLASIIGSLEVYERMGAKLPADRQQALVALALQEAYRLDSFVTNILDMAKLENGMVKMQRETAEIGSVIRNCMLRMGNRLQGSKVTINAPPEVFDVITDPMLLGRAVGLVLDNAVKYGGSPPVITIELGKENSDRAYVVIRDNGRGIPEAKIEEIFSKYTRFAKQDQQAAGTGLGLAIGREIMRLLGGSLTAVNDAQGGAAFTLRLPLVSSAA